MRNSLLGCDDKYCGQTLSAAAAFVCQEACRHMLCHELLMWYTALKVDALISGCMVNE